MTSLSHASPLADDAGRIFRDVFERSPDAIVILDTALRYVEQNDAHRALGGYEDADLLGRTPALLLGPDHFASLADSLARTGRFQREVKGRRGDGSPLIVAISVFTVRGPADAALCHVGIARDVTGERLAQEALARSQRNLADFVETSAIGLHWVGPDGIILWANHADHEPLGYAREEFVGRHIADFHADREVIDDILARLARNERLHGYPARLRAKDGSIRHVVIDSSVLWEDGKFVHTRCFTRDVTAEKLAKDELEAARAQLAASEKLSALGTLVSGVAHEIRTPLTYIANNIALAQLALSRAEPDAGQVASRHLAQAQEGVDRVNALVKDLRRYTQLKAEVVVEAGLDAVVKEAADLFLATHRGGARISLDLRPVPPMRMGKLQLQQVVLNLLENAVDAAPTGHVTLSTEATPEGGILRVHDDGAGVLPSVRDRMFEPFVTSKPHGTGLGLSIARRAVDAHGGSIACVSEPGQGTTFIVSLPRGGPVA